MSEQRGQRVWLQRQADRIERTLTALELPVRVSGGRVSEGRVRYHVTPMALTRAEQIEAAGSDVAAALGAPRINVARERNGLSIEVESSGGDSLRLLPLMHALGDPDPLTAVLGMSDDGRPLTFSLAGEAPAHLWIEGGAGSGKSELLRTAALSLALASRPAQLQLMGVDLSGRELLWLDSLPHTLATLARDAGVAEDLLRWLAREVERRLRLALTRPALLLLIDDASALAQVESGGALAALGAVAERAAETGVHVFAAGRNRPGELPLAISHGDAAVRAEGAGGTGRFRFQHAQTAIMAQAAWLPARELATAVALASERPGALYAADFILDRKRR